MRDKILNDFKSGKTQFLLTTDVARRGLDIPNLNYVLNYDFPSNLVTYISGCLRSSFLHPRASHRAHGSERQQGLRAELHHAQHVAAGAGLGGAAESEWWEWLGRVMEEQPVPKLLAELAEEQKRLMEFGKWEVGGCGEGQL